MPEKGPVPSPTEEPETRVKSFRSFQIDRELGERFMNQVQENVSSVLEFSLQWEEYDKAMELREISMRKYIVELKERLRLVEEREKNTEEESDLKLFLEANVMRLFFQMQSEEVVFAQLKTQEKLIDLMNCSMKKKHEEQMRELEAKKEEVALLSKSIEEKSYDLEMKVKDFNLKQTAETERKRKEAELMEISLNQLKARENELVLFNDTIREKSSELEKKEENFILKQQAEAREIDLKNKFLELKEKELEERSLQAKTCKRCRIESEHSLSEEKDRYAESMIRPGKKHKSISSEHNHNDEDKKKYGVTVVPPSTSSHVQISKAREGENEEAVFADGIADDMLVYRVDSERFQDQSEKVINFADDIDEVPIPLISVDTDSELYQDLVKTGINFANDIDEDPIPPSTSSHIQISEVREREIEEAVSIDGIDEDHMPIACVDSEFNDFSKTINSFVVGQVWAIYDKIDSMPRYYARIKKVSKSESSFVVTWLEPKDKEDVLVSCGRFKWGATETIKSRTVFSHVMHPIIIGKNYIAVIPRKGETWALFSEWSQSWNNNPEQHKPPYRYDFVEVVVDFDDCLGIGVAYLGKVEGFAFVYKQADKNGVVSLIITPEEMSRFSHRVPSFKMNAEEKEGVPTEFFELDPAAISSSIP